MSFNVNATTAQPAAIDQGGILPLIIKKFEFTENQFKQPVLRLSAVSQKQYDNLIYYSPEDQEKYDNRKYVELDFSLTYNGEWNKSWGNVETFFGQIGGEENYNCRNELGAELEDKDTSMTSQGAENLAEALTTVLKDKPCYIAVKAKEWNDQGGVNLSFASNMKQLKREFVSKDGKRLTAVYNAYKEATGKDPLLVPYRGAKKETKNDNGVDVTDISF
jgi:hypothetical protein